MNKQIYYHFLPPDCAIDDLKKGKIKVSTLRSLNDPFEMVPYLRHKGVEGRRPYNKIRKEISKKYGLLCFSQNWQEPLLWSHYADKHKGIAIGFELLKDEVLKVEYTSNLRKQIILTENSEINESLFLDLAKVKYKKWEYENEYRILVKLTECKEIEEFFFAPFNNRLKVKEIILGCKFDHEKKRENIIKLASFYDAKITPTRLGWGDYKIHRCGYKTKKYEEFYKLMLI
ncbi:DUF2971 domain-containing protein [Patescibacteria group bacterium]|nr:DUF2971 domain-containing protein [Patescibacteria group bacterium]MBU4016528.1 DUF2971 domain-containing protein [Patescibacteria group bacterium]MBU4098037.1 DUF2971 domain-containing protein [Patescibacteria group bacterium]